MPGRLAGHGEHLAVEELVLAWLFALPREVLGCGQLGALGDAAHADSVLRRSGWLALQGLREGQSRMQTTPLNPLSQWPQPGRHSHFNTR